MVIRTAPPLLRVSKELAATNMRMHGSREHRPTLYAVVVRDHPNLVKVGQTARWDRRRKAYDCWNLRVEGDGVVEFRTFLITEEYVDLLGLEGACLSEMPSLPVFGREWFRETLETASRVIDRVICGAGLSYL